MFTTLPASAGTHEVSTTVKIGAPPRVKYGLGPLDNVAVSIEQMFICIIKHESRSYPYHLNLGDNNSNGSSGIFQIEPIVWNRWAPKVGIHVPIWKATVLQQEQGALEIYKHDGWAPWRGDCGI